MKDMAITSDVTVAFPDDDDGKKKARREAIRMAKEANRKEQEDLAKAMEEIDGDRLMSSKEAAAYIGIPHQTLFRWRVDGYGPPAYKLPKCLRYRKSLIDKWLKTTQDDWDGSGPR